MATPPTMPKQAPGPGAGFSNQYSDMKDAIDARVTGSRPRLGKEARKMQAQARDVHRQMRQARPAPATVINMQPFPLKVNGVLFGDIEIPACPEGYEYTQYTIHNYKVAHKDLGDGNFAFYAEVPLALAHEFEREFEDFGGVFYYPGAFAPEGAALDIEVQRLTLPDDPDNEPRVKVGDLLKAAKDRMVARAIRMYNDAETAWNSPQGDKRGINQWHRRAALILLKEGRITEPPKWMAHTRPVAEIGEKCPLCTIEAKPGAIICANCRYPFDVVEAFRHGALDRNSPHLGRMTPTQLKRFKLDHIESILSDEEIEEIEQAEEERKKAAKKRAKEAQQAVAEAQKADEKKAKTKDEPPANSASTKPRE